MFNSTKQQSEEQNISLTLDVKKNESKDLNSLEECLIHYVEWFKYHMAPWNCQDTYNQPLLLFSVC